MSQPIRVLVVDDSAFTRHILVKSLAADPEIVVVGEARDGIDALAKIAEHRPDVVTLDVEMPHLDGLATLQHIMAEYPTPVIMLSALTQSSARTTVRALLLGAVDCVPKPSAAVDLQGVVADLAAKIKVAARTTLKSQKIVEMPPVVNKSAQRPFREGDPLIVIGASAGGPRALRQILPNLPADLPAAVVVVQHMPAAFTLAMAQRFDEMSALTIREVKHGEHLACGKVLIAPGDYHLRFSNHRKIVLDQAPRRHGVRPAVDVSLETAAEQYGKAAIGVILTGMGTDGTLGARAIKSTGGRVIAEHQSTCLVYGMPRSVIESDMADKIVPLSEVVSTLLEWIE